MLQYSIELIIKVYINRGKHSAVANTVETKLALSQHTDTGEPKMDLDLRGSTISTSPARITNSSRARSEPFRTHDTHSMLGSPPNSRWTKSCRSELDMTVMNEHNRERLIEAFLPDLRKNHTRMGYIHRVQPFNLNQEKLRTVQIRAKTASYNRDLREHSNISLGRGRKAANSTTPRPKWAVKPIPMNSSNDRLCPDITPQTVAFVKRHQWSYSDGRSFLDRPLPKRSPDK